PRREREPTRDDPEAVLRGRGPETPVAEAALDEPACALGPAERGQRVEGQVARRRLGLEVEGDAVGRRVLLRRARAARMEQAGEGEELAAEDAEDGPRVALAL